MPCCASRVGVIALIPRSSAATVNRLSPTGRHDVRLGGGDLGGEGGPGHRGRGADALQEGVLRLAGRRAGEHADPHRAALAQVPGQRAGVDPADADHALGDQVVLQRALRAPAGGPHRGVAHDVAGDPDPARLVVLVVDAGVADVRRGHDDDLPVVAGVGQRLLVAGHAGGEDGLADGLADARRRTRRGRCGRPPGRGRPARARPAGTAAGWAGPRGCSRRSLVSIRGGLGAACGRVLLSGSASVLLSGAASSARGAPGKVPLDGVDQLLGLRGDAREEAGGELGAVVGAPGAPPPGGSGRPTCRPCRARGPRRSAAPGRCAPRRRPARSQRTPPGPTAMVAPGADAQPAAATRSSRRGDGGGADVGALGAQLLGRGRAGRRRGAVVVACGRAAGVLVAAVLVGDRCGGVPARAAAPRGVHQGVDQAEGDEQDAGRPQCGSRQRSLQDGRPAAQDRGVDGTAQGAAVPGVVARQGQRGVAVDA